jgi:hypothetical protein
MDKGDRKMAKEYLAYITEFGIGSQQDLEEGKELELVVKDLTPGKYKYESRFVKARVGRPETLPGSDALKVRFAHGTLCPRTYAIKITEELGELPILKAKSDQCS